MRGSLRPLAPPQLPSSLVEVEAIDALMADGFSTTRTIDAETFRALQAAGFGPEGEAWKSDPWAAIIHLEVLRQAQELDGVAHIVTTIKDARARAEKDAGGEALSNEEFAAAAGRALGEGMDYAPDLAQMEARVGDILERWPDHPAADHARVYGVIAATSGGTYEPATAKKFVDELMASDAPQLTSLALEFAATLPSAPNGVRYTEEDYARLGAWADAHPEHPLPHDLVDHCSVQAMDKQDAEGWFRRREASVEKLCATGRFGCDLIRAEGARRRAYLDERQGAPPGTWQAALTVMVRECDRMHRVDEVSIGVASWDDGWTWHDTHPPGPFIDCVTRATMPQPHPEPGQLLLLEAAPPGVPLLGPQIRDVVPMSEEVGGGEAAP